ncbi:ParB/RepB/Spo0J family partition protein [Microbulbifer sp. THAF38]|uniref:ParB/RepB/Spo0J family partition protein n=1 Tax=Microbulbifer sp. THAF38 TaxID=2587856 RepID=UPI00126938CB|nr:ParB/RepB/Spo0J family partition protein [Microbulbifer sp. THAF38]QFT57163.1 Chromosome-partitioning protein Spo0J [Microbulbifer sp. THAF38]
MAKDKYGNIDEMLSGADTDELVDITPKRNRRPSPALGVMTGDNRPTSITDGLKAEKQKAEKALEEAQLNFEKEKADLLQALEEVKNSDSEGAPIVLTMPVTKQEITFELRRIDPSLIDVSPENERIQEFLDEISLQDILPSIKKHSQQKPGTVRPKKDGRFELIEGSRRLASVKLAKQEYLALVGDVPDADVRELSIIENKHQDVSPYEKAKTYQKQIERGEFENWTQLGAAKGISSSHISRFRACVELDEIFVRILPSPSDMPLSYGETIASLRKKGESPLIAKAEELLDLRRAALRDKLELPDVEQVIKLLKGAVRSKVKEPKTWKPVVYKSKDGKTLKHSVTNKGATKFEITGVDDSQLKKILSFLTTTLKVGS